MMMWRLLKQAAIKSKIQNKIIYHHYSSSVSSLSKSKKVAIVITTTGLVSTVLYSKCESKLKDIFGRNVSYIDEIYKHLPNFHESKNFTPTISPGNKKEDSILSDLLKEEQDVASKSEKFGVESKIRELPLKGSSEKTINSDLNKLENESGDQINSLSEKQALELAFNESLLIDLMKELESSSNETLSAYEIAFKAIIKHIKSLCVALNLSNGPDSNIIWEQASQASNDRQVAIENAQEKASNTKALIEKLKANARNVAVGDPKHPLIKMCEVTIDKIDKDLYNSETKIKSVENEIKITSEYQKLVNRCKEEFLQELQIMLPNYAHGLSDKRTIAESDLNILIAHAHQKIEQLQKQLAKQQVTERIRLDEALRQQKLNDVSLTKAKTVVELEKRNIEIKIAVARRVASLRENFESELKKILYFQAVAHNDHVQEILEMHEQELEQKYSKDLEEKLLHMKGVIKLETSELMARLKELLVFLKAKRELEVESRKSQLLWLSCQSLIKKISSGVANLSPLEEDIASIKFSTHEDNAFVNTTLAEIPNEAVTRGVYSPDILKQRFLHVKKICKKVAMIDECNDSLYRYLLSYLQSYLIVDEIFIPTAELKGRVAVDTRDWDTCDILSRISYSLKTDNLEQALRYANQLKGEARTVAKDWIKELRLLLETQIVVKALSAHAAAVNVQAYH